MTAMTPEEAKTSLSLCPPEDETNPDVPRLAEARELAAANPGLAAWWEQEKNFDLLFSRKLGSLTPPPELQSTIMRGGATIFFASRLIAESADEADDEDAPAPEPVLLPIAHTTTSALPDLEETATEDQPGESRVKLRLLWRMGLVIVGIIGLLVLAGLYFFEFGLAHTTNPGGPVNEIAKLEALADDLAPTTETAPAPGKTVEEMRKFLDDSRAPNPPEWPQLIMEPPPGTAVSVAAENWNRTPVTHFTVQSGKNLSHLIILRTADLRQSDIQVDNFSGARGPFNEQIWSTDGYIFIQLTPLEPKS